MAFPHATREPEINDQDRLYAGFIRDVKFDPSLNGHLMDEVSVMCTC